MEIAISREQDADLMLGLSRSAFREEEKGKKHFRIRINLWNLLLRIVTCNGGSCHLNFECKRTNLVLPSRHFWLLSMVKAGNTNLLVGGGITYRQPPNKLAKPA